MTSENRELWTLLLVSSYRKNIGCHRLFITFSLQYCQLLSMFSVKIKGIKEKIFSTRGERKKQRQDVKFVNIHCNDVCQRMTTISFWCKPGNTDLCQFKTQLLKCISVILSSFPTSENGWTFQWWWSRWFRRPCLMWYNWGQTEGLFPGYCSGWYCCWKWTLALAAFLPLCSAS